MLSEEEAENIKKQILKQVETWPEEQRERAKQQILAMSPKELEDFLVQNKLIRQQGQQPQTSQTLQTQPATQGQQCVFCMLAEGKMQSFKIAENKDAIALLEINPLSKGHTIIIPRKHVKTEKIPSSAFTLAKKVSKKLKKLKPANIEISASNRDGHAIINIIPLYKDQKPEQKQASPEELKEVQEKLTIKKTTRKPKLKKQSGKKTKKIHKIPMKIP